MRSVAAPVAIGLMSLSHAGCGDCIEDICNDVLYVNLLLPPGSELFQVEIQTYDGTTVCALQLPLTTATACSDPIVTSWSAEDESRALFAFKNKRKADFRVTTGDTLVLEQTVETIDRDYYENPDTADLCSPCGRADILLDASNFIVP